MTTGLPVARYSRTAAICTSRLSRTAREVQIKASHGSIGA